MVTADLVVLDSGSIKILLLAMNLFLSLDCTLCLFFLSCVHIVQLVKTFTEEKMQLITGNIDFVCCQCWKKEKRERFHFPDLINNFFYLRTLHLEFVNCVMCEKDSLFVLFTNQASIYSRDVYIYVYPGYSKKLYLEYHAYKLG